MVFSHLRPGKHDEAIGYAEESVAANKQEVGFKGQLFLVVQESGKVLSLTLWEAEAHVKASAGGSLSAAACCHVPRLARSPLIEVYQVHIQE